MRKPFLFVILVITFGLLLTACAPESGSSGSALSDNPNNAGQAGVVDDVSDPNILQIAIGSEDHSTLVAAVQAAEMEKKIALLTEKNRSLKDTILTNNDKYSKKLLALEIAEGKRLSSDSSSVQIEMQVHQEGEELSYEV